MPTNRSIALHRIRPLTFAACIALSACGSGGGGSSSGGSGGNPPPPGSTATRPPFGTATPKPSGGQSVDTPTPTPTPTPNDCLRVVSAGQNILDVVKAAGANCTVVVAPGIYEPLTLNSSEVPDGVVLEGDCTGAFTGTPGNVTLKASSGEAALIVAGVADVFLDCFTFVGGSRAAIIASNADGFALEDSVISSNSPAPGDGIQLIGGDGAFLFNDLIDNRAGTGIHLFGATDPFVINTTVVRNHMNGIWYQPGPPPSGAVDFVYARNNLVSLNAPLGIVADPTTMDYDSDFNLNTDGYGDSTVPGDHDLTADPLFFNASGGDFHLNNGSPAIDAGDDSIDATLCDPTDSSCSFLAPLEDLTTTHDLVPDMLPIDIGFHFEDVILPPDTPTPSPTPTKAGARTPTRTRTRTPTP